MTALSKSHFSVKPLVVTAALFSVVLTAVAIVPGASVSVPTQTVSKLLPTPEVQPIELPDTSFWHEERVRSGDSISSLFLRLSIDDGEAASFMRTHPVARRIVSMMRPGRYVKAETDQDGKLRSLYYPVDQDMQIVVFREGNHLFATEQKRRLEKRLQMRSGTIKASLIGATDAAGIPEAVAMQMVKILGTQIDFLRDLRKGDHFSVLYEAQYDQGGRAVNAGKVLALDFTNRQKTHQAIFFDDGAAQGGYYTPDFKPLNSKFAFLRSPIEFSRVTSGFSRRKHPIFQDWRQHKGIDYAAPIGTRIQSTANGVVKFAGKQRGYGNVVIISHPNGYESLYAHMRGFGKGIQKGAKVAQGQTVGFVGMTGWTTGPHLHYEVRQNGKHINPLGKSVQTALSNGAQQKYRAAFMKAKVPLMATLAMLKQSQVVSE